MDASDLTLLMFPPMSFAPVCSSTVGASATSTRTRTSDVPERRHCDSRTGRVSAGRPQDLRRERLAKACLRGRHVGRTGAEIGLPSARWSTRSPTTTTCAERRRPALPQTTRVRATARTAGTRCSSLSDTTSERYLTVQLPVPGALFGFTLGGLRTDVDSAVLDGDGQPIAGLFAAGRASAGLAVGGYCSGSRSVIAPSSAAAPGNRPLAADQHSGSLLQSDRRPFGELEDAWTRVATRYRDTRP